MKKQLLASIIGVSLVTTGCVPVVIGGIATAGYLTAQERGAKNVILDTKIKTHIKDKLTSKKYYYLSQVEVNVLKGSVLLTGVVESDEAKAEIEQIVKNIEGVGVVYNELFTSGTYEKARYAQDSWLSTQIKTKLLTAGDIYSINYFISVVNGNAYILGLAETQSEMERAIYIARTTSGVRKVHNYVKYTNRGLVRTENLIE